MKKFLGIDYGTKRVGLAVSAATLAEPLFVLENKLADQEQIASDQVLAEIAKICSERKIDEIVLGLSEAAMALKIQSFAKLLEDKIGLPVNLTDETLSSYEVGRRMKEASFSLRKRQGPIDHYSAALILEDFLETVPRP